MLLVALALLTRQAPADTGAFPDPRTQELVSQAIRRHHAQDQAVRDYQARFRYRLSFGLGRRRWASMPNAAVEEQDGTIAWALPNDLRVDIVGRRARARATTLQLSSSFDRPWFIPRSLGDSIRVFGNEIPSRPALHPLADAGPEWYQYRLVDSLELQAPGGKAVRLLGIEVLPRRVGPSLIAGRLWIDAASFDLVRLTFRFVGSQLWLDPDEDEGDAATRRANRQVNRLLTLEADLQYALQEQQFWMPYRQVVSGRVELPFLGELVIPFEATTTFEDYQINSGQPVTFALSLPAAVTDPDSLAALLQARRDSLRAERRRRTREGGELPEDARARDDAGRWEDGRYEIHRAPADSLRGYDQWGDSLTLADDPQADQLGRSISADLERLEGTLPDELVGRRRKGWAWERLPQLIRYNRVQGFAPGSGYDLLLDRAGFTTLRGDLRYGFSDSRLVGNVTLRREAPGARWTVAAIRDLVSHDPLARGSGFGPSLNAMLAGHDDADYLLTHRLQVTRESSLGTGVELTTSFGVGREQSVVGEAYSWLNDALGGDGDFPPNPAVRSGSFGRAAVALDQGLLRSRWTLLADLQLGDGVAVARWMASYRLEPGFIRQRPSLQVRAGIATGSQLPQQLFRLGGPGTVRGYDYGSLREPAFWAAQGDWPLRSGLIQPVLFADAGQAAEPSQLFSSKALVSAGAGLKLAGGILRLDLSHSLTGPNQRLRFDLTVGSGF